LLRCGRFAAERRAPNMRHAFGRFVAARAARSVAPRPWAPRAAPSPPGPRARPPLACSARGSRRSARAPRAAAAASAGKLTVVVCSCDGRRAATTTVTSLPESWLLSHSEQLPSQRSHNYRHSWLTNNYRHSSSSNSCRSREQLLSQLATTPSHLQTTPSAPAPRPGRSRQTAPVRDHVCPMAKTKYIFGCQQLSRKHIVNMAAGT